MASVYSIAAHITSRLGGVDRYKLHKLVYYVQAWSLVWQGRPAFEGRIEAWTNGPVAEQLQAELVHRAGGLLRQAPPLAAEEAALVDRVLLAYGHMTADALIDLTHKEAPWKDARGDLPQHAKSSELISHEAMTRFYRERWLEADQDNDAIDHPPEFTGSVDEFERYLNS